jgi:hypothetical protein
LVAGGVGILSLLPAWARDLSFHFRVDGGLLAGVGLGLIVLAITNLEQTCSRKMNSLEPVREL